MKAAGEGKREREMCGSPKGAEVIKFHHPRHHDLVSNKKKKGFFALLSTQQQRKRHKVN